MSLFTVPEELATVLNRLSYAAGAMAGVASGLLEVTARLFLAGLRAAKNENTLALQAGTPSDDPQRLKQGSRSQQQHRTYLLPWLMCISLPRNSNCSAGAAPEQASSTSPTAPSTPKADDPIPHTPVDVSGAPSEEVSSSKSVVSPAAETCTSTEAARWPSSFEENSNASNVASGDSSMAASAQSSTAQCVEASAEVAEPVAVPNDSMVDALISAVYSDMWPTEDMAPVVSEALDGVSVPNAAGSIPVIVDIGDAAFADTVVPHLTHGSLIDTELPMVQYTSGPTFHGEIIGGMDSVKNALEVSGLNVECAHSLREAASELAPHRAQTQSPSCVNAVQHRSDETCSESGESSSTAFSYGTANSLDSPHKSSRTRGPSGTASASGTSSAQTPGLSYAQRLEEKRQSKRRKGAHKAQAR